MSFFRGPKIITDGLILYLDAGNIKSYPTSGTAWTDLVKINNGTLSNSTFDSSVNGNIIFNGTSTKLDISDIALGNGFLPWTVSAWVKTATAGTGLGSAPILTNNSGGPVYSHMGINSGKVVYWVYYTTWVQNLGTITVNDDKWHLLTWVNKNDATMDLYVDGVYDTTIADSRAATANPVNIIGASWAPAYFNGQIANVKIYNTSLSQTEISQNYNAIKSRFGL